MQRTPLAWLQLLERRWCSLTVKKRGKVWWYDFGNHKYRGPIPEARTKHEAQQAEIKLKRDVFEGKFGRQFGTMLFADFVGNPDAENNEFGDGSYLEWAKNNKRSWRHDRFRVRVLLQAFRGRSLGEVSPLAIERLKSSRQHS